MAIDSIKQTEFSELKSLYFSTAYHGPIPKSAFLSGQRALLREQNPSFMPYEEWQGLSERGRQMIAEIFGVKADNIAHSTSTSEIISHIVNGLSLPKGSAVVQIEGEYPSDVLPWMLLKDKLDLQHTFLPEEFFLNPSENKSLLPKNTSVINCSHVRFDTGTKLNIEDLSQLCSELGIWFILDTTQSFGGMPIPKNVLSKADIIVNSTYKWCLGPYGHAFAYFSDRALHEIKPTHISWLTVKPSKSGRLTEYHTDFNVGARRFDRGQTANLIQLSTLISSLELLKEAGLGEIEQHNQKLVNFFTDHLPKNKFALVTQIQHRSNIVCLKSLGSESSNEISLKLKSNNIDCTIREGNLRFSFHLFNDQKEVERLVQVLTN